jgi:hypothetical protein
MNTKKLVTLLGLLVAVAVAGSACSLNIERNPDGSLTVESSMTEASLQAEIEAAIADPLIRDLTADLRNGYVFVSAERQRLGSEQTDTMTFRLDLGVSDGHLAATISEAQINGLSIEEERVALWNERIATKLERAGQRNPDSTLQAVTISQDAVTMVWRVETPRSRGG